MHWHGLLQQRHQWDDGVPGTSECPIAPGSSHTYTFVAAQYGTTWYHSHYSAQYADGIFGALIVHGPSALAYDIDVGPVIVQDYYHRSYENVVNDVMGNDLTKIRPPSDNNLINGKGRFDCSTMNSTTASNLTGTCSNNAPYSRLNFVSGKTHRLRIINAGAAGIQKFSIDGHTMEVIAMDFTPIQPLNTSIITLSVGQRVDVLVKAVGSPRDTYWLRSTLTSGQCTEPADQRYGLAVIQYEGANAARLPTSTATVDTTDQCAGQPLAELIPLYTQPALNPTITIDVEVNFAVNGTGHLNWLMNNQTFQANWNNPILLLSKSGNNSYPYDPQWNAIEVRGNNASILRVTVNNLTPTSHPMHLHGHNM